MDWPSRELSQRLAEWGLCSPQDLHRCRASVRRFVRDLPTFDSVWIDALLQQRTLTPYQARVLDSAYPERLKMAGCVISECLEDNAWRSVYRARPLEGGPSCLLTVLPVHVEDRTRVRQAIDDIIMKLGGLTVGSVNCHSRVLVDGSDVIIASDDVDGVSLKELLIRRGRFPAQDVEALTRGLIEAMASLEGRGVVHGDLRPRNVRISPDGRIHLLAAGVLPAVMPTFSVTQELPVEVCDQIAPEVVRGRRMDHVSDQYALGCLLWQLIAGRPPFPTGDPLSKLSAHENRRIPELCDYAPQTPPKLAALIRRLTERLPTDRMPSFRTLLQQMGPPLPSDRRLLKRFVTSFETDAPTATVRETGAVSRQLPGAVMATVIGAATVWLLFSDATPARTIITPQVAATSPAASSDLTAPPAPFNAKEPVRTAQSGAASDSSILQVAGSQPEAAPVPLPSPDETGLVQLKAGVTYQARKLSAPGVLTIQGPEKGLARIVTGTAGLELQADTLRLDRVRIDVSHSTPNSGVRLISRMLQVLNSQWISAVQTGPLEPDVMVQWQPRDRGAASPGAIVLENTILSGTGLAVEFRPSLIRATNCLKTGPAPMFLVGPKGRSNQTMPVHVVHCTVRQSGPLLLWNPGPRAAGLKIDLLTKSCLFDMAEGRPLLGLQGSLPPAGWEQSLTMGGLLSLMSTGGKVVDLEPLPGKPRGAFDSSALGVEGLMTAEVEFFGPNVDDPASSALKGTDALFSVDTPPGIQASKLSF